MQEIEKKQEQIDETQLKNTLLDWLDDMQALDVVDIDITKSSSLMNTVIIATANSTRHAKALCDHLKRRAKEEKILVLGSEGEQSMDWILIDFFDIIVHIMIKETREYYELEKLYF